jgi:hypothetical protein
MRAVWRSLTDAVGTTVRTAQLNLALHFNRQEIEDHIYWAWLRYRGAGRDEDVINMDPDDYDRFREEVYRIIGAIPGIPHAPSEENT